MAKNTLFNFLSQNEDIVRLLPEHSLVLDFNKTSQHYYYRIELPIEKFMVEDQENHYLLDNHHISVYENENHNNPKLSQYHYTAEFINQSGERYRLHVYFNAFDELIQNIAFEQETVDGYKLVDSKTMRNQLIILALKHTEPLIKELRQQHYEKIKGLEAHYKDCDKKLEKYFDLDQKNAAEILAITEEACKVLKELIPLIRSSSYPGFLRFHEASARALKKALEHITSTQKPDRNGVEASEDVQDIAEENSNTQDESPLQGDLHDEGDPKEAPFSHEKMRQITKPTNLVIQQLEKEIRTLGTQFEELSMAPMEVQAKKIEQLLAKTYEINLTYEHQIKLNDLHQLQKIRRDLQKLEADLLPSLLFKGQFELAALLTSSHHMLRAEKFLSVALQTRNTKLLDFILTHGGIDINNQPVTVHHHAFPSAVHACVQGDSPSNPMSECLSVLIKHGASLFAPDNKGLPLVYSILTGDMHPLRKALFMNRSRTIESIDFFKKLIALLRACLTQDSLSENEKNTIELDLKSFEYQLEILQNAHLEDPSSRFLMKRANHLEEKYLGVFISKLRQDSDVMELNQKVQKAAAALNSKLSKAQKRQAKILLSNNLEDLEKILDGIDVMSFDFDFLKTQVLKGFNNNLQLIEKQSLLIDLQKEIKRHHNSKNRKYKALLREQNELLQEISELEKKNPLLQAFEAMDNSSQVLEGLASLSEQLKTLSQDLESLKGMGNLLTQFSGIFSSPSNDATALSSTKDYDSEEDEATPVDFEKVFEDLGSLIKKSSF
ncbi:coiled-coil-containing protein [Legionella steigerwaltii]|uniref:Coiled-coil-containing protein n=1 Tax=Legionella steigerwaltii TaxID=460 RepID=A0A378L4E4_9GAMM|nr:hypothetical protein [Legionella steigerwaltii]KTD72010.1 coiled-coil-containing protein [Legionella steigerwaltii]STY21676.1 coiled-coil-containing protein [Legionella steigerwaltii]